MYNKNNSRFHLVSICLCYRTKSGEKLLKYILTILRRFLQFRCKVISPFIVSYHLEAPLQ